MWTWSIVIIEFIKKLLNEFSFLIGKINWIYEFFIFHCIRNILQVNEYLKNY